MALLSVLRHVGFGPQFIAWVCALLSSASSKILLNGIPGRPFLHRCGLRQGDLLSPMLFLLAMEVLNALLAKAEGVGVLSPLPCRGVRFRTSMYADDVIIFVNPTPTELSPSANQIGPHLRSHVSFYRHCWMDRRWIRDITGVLNARIITQFLLLTDFLLDVHLEPGTADRIFLKWTSSGVYSASSTYIAFFAGLVCFPAGKALWRTIKKEDIASPSDDANNHMT